MTTMTAAQFPAANAALELVKREVPEPGAGQVLLRVRACGICHSDLFVPGGRVARAEAPARPRARGGRGGGAGRTRRATVADRRPRRRRPGPARMAFSSL